MGLGGRVVAVRHFGSMNSPSETAKMTTLADVAAARARLAEWFLSSPETSGFRPPDVNWTYDGDKHVEAVEREAVIVIGFNAGAGKGATETRISPGEKAWRTHCERLTGGFCTRFVLSDLIPLGSHNEKELRIRLPDLGPAFAAGADVNHVVIAYHQPKLIFQIGLNDPNEVSRFYGLKLVSSRQRPAHPTHVLLRHYEMADGTPWIAIMHFARPGYSNMDREAIREYAKGILSG
jgi:hypothetical protein